MQIVKAFLVGAALALGVASHAGAQPQPALPNFADLVEKHQANLEQIFLNIIGYQPQLSA